MIKALFFRHFQGQIIDSLESIQGTTKFIIIHHGTEGINSNVGPLGSLKVPSFRAVVKNVSVEKKMK